MYHATIAHRGAIVCLDRRVWLIWDADYPRPWCMPIVPQHKPRLRTDVPIPAGHGIAGLPKQAPMVRAAVCHPIETHGALVLGELSAAVMGAIETALRRAAASEATERQYRHRVK